jgi:sarcosine oxidase subunit gamma
MADAALHLADLPPCTRMILRGRATVIEAATAPLGFALPTRPCHAVTVRHRSALWLGPDEWLILSAPSDPVAAALAQTLQPHPHSLVDVTHRQCAIELTGAAAADVLNAGCPLDLDAAAFPVGMCTRTVLAKSEIILWRVAEEKFRLEVTRSFAPYVRSLLLEAARDILSPTQRASDKEAAMDAIEVHPTPNSNSARSPARATPFPVAAASNVRYPTF